MTSVIEVDPIPGGGAWIWQDGVHHDCTCELKVNLTHRRAWLHGLELDDAEIYVDHVIQLRIPPAIRFVVDDVYEIKDRGVGITRDRDSAVTALRAGERFEVGQWLQCNEEETHAKIIGIEYYRGGGYETQNMQQALLLGPPLQRSQVHARQIWRRGTPLGVPIPMGPIVG